MMIFARSCADSQLHISIPPSLEESSRETLSRLTSRWERFSNTLLKKKKKKEFKKLGMKKEEKTHKTNSPFIFQYKLVNDFIHFCVHFWFIVFVAFVMDCYSYCCCCFIIRRKCNSSDILALEEKCIWFLYCNCFVHIERLFDSVV